MRMILRVIRAAARAIGVSGAFGKENRQLAVFPVENHGFEDDASWADEYKRIFRLFEENLKGR